MTRGRYWGLAAYIFLVILELFELLHNPTVVHLQKISLENILVKYVSLKRGQDLNWVRTYFDKSITF